MSTGRQERYLSKALLAYKQAERADRAKVMERVVRETVRLRKQYDAPDGSPDWMGRSYPYRAALGRAYVAADIPPAERPRITAAVRYHITPVLRELGVIPQGNTDSNEKEPA